MTITGSREVVGRAYSHKFGETPNASRKWIISTDGTPISQSEAFGALGLSHKAPHPENPNIELSEMSVSEGSPTKFHYEVTANYELIEASDNPLAQPDVWSFSTSSAAVPAYTYYDGNGNADIQPMKNSAGDYFEGATRDCAELRASIAGNRAQFPLALAVNATNAINSTTYLGAPQYAWKCMGISAAQATELIDDEKLTYWKITVELAYRAEGGWPLQLPDVGYNCLEGGTKIRAWVLDPDDKYKGIDTRLPCASPVPLNADGTIKVWVQGMKPDIIVRRTNAAVDFNSLFGTPNF